MSKVREVPVRVEDHNDIRVITIHGPHFARNLVRAARRYETKYSRDMVLAILEVKGSQFVVNEILRESDPDYVQKPLEQLILPVMTLEDRKVLDFGSGAGASSICLGRLGASVVGVDVDDQLIRVGRLRSIECLGGERVGFCRISHVPRLPFADHSFDAVVCSGVVEHLYPRTRKLYVTELWRVVRPGGYLFIHGTPNRVWPIDGHTTGLPLIPWLPLGLARWCAILFSNKVTSADTADDLIQKGIRGATYWDFQGLEKAVVVETEDDRRAVESSVSGRQNLLLQLAKIAFLRTFNLGTRVGFSIPLAAFRPYLNLRIRKNV